VRTQLIDVAPGETAKVNFHLDEGKVRFIVKPWANVTVDGKPLGATPMPDQELYEGAHQVVMENPKLGKSVHRAVNVTAGQTAEVKADLTQP
jgi:hypothetical protein